MFLKIERAPDKIASSSYVVDSVDFGSAMESLVCEIDRNLNLSRLSNDDHVDKEEMTVAAPLGVSTSN